MDYKLYIRIILLIFGGILGLVLAFFTIKYLPNMLSSLNHLDSKLVSSLVILALGLPTFFILWWFRTKDVKTQIEKSQKQIEKTQENINQ